MERYYKDPVLAGIYVKRCKCGARPYHDRTAIGTGLHWIGYECGKTAKCDWDLQVAIDNWNNGIYEFRQWMSDESFNKHIDKES